MTEILLEVTTEEIRSAALEASHRAKGKSGLIVLSIYSCIYYGTEKEVTFCLKSVHNDF